MKRTYKIIAAMLCAASVLSAGCARQEAIPELPPEQPVQVEMQQPEPVPEPEPEPEPEPVVKTAQATVAATGDILMHYPIIKSGLDPQTGEYSFEEIFAYISPYVEEADYAAANLETTLSGLDNGYPYQGYPRFNCPDGIVDSLKNAGFDMLLTANNHSYDTGSKGFLRTLSVIDETGLDRIGTNAVPEEKKYTVQEVNGISIGMTCFTYETEDGDPATKSLNCIPLSAQSGELVNSFHPDRLDDFYTELENQLKAMEGEGAQATVLFIHWGNEYQTGENELQRTMAQEICDLGVDVIIGGHPHVLQPVELLSSTTDPGHTTVCLYSMGNAVSNQRLEQIPSAGGYTEDGVLFQVTFGAYSDGSVVLEGVEALPTWVNLTRDESTGAKIYEIIPLDEEVEDWQTAFTLTQSELADAQESYRRSVSILGEGLEQIRAGLEQRSE